MRGLRTETEHVWERMSGRGRIWSFVVAHAPVLPVFSDRVPMPVAVVELEEDSRIRIVGALAPGTDPAEVSIGAAVVADFETVDDEIGLVRWRLV
jgi:uncharacterized OB-fold protein